MTYGLGMRERLPSEVHVPSERFVLRRYVVGDIEPLGQAIRASIDHLRRFMPWASREPLTPAARRELFSIWDAEWEAGTSSVYGMFAGDDVIGGCGLHRRRPGDPGVVEIGYWVHVDHTRQGIATEAARALTEAAFTVPGITTVEIWHEPDNVASGAIPRRLGYRLTGDEVREGLTFRVWRIDTPPGAAPDP